MSKGFKAFIVVGICLSLFIGIWAVVWVGKAPSTDHINEILSEIRSEIKDLSLDVSVLKFGTLVDIENDISSLEAQLADLYNDTSYDSNSYDDGSGRIILSF